MVRLIFAFFIFNSFLSYAQGAGRLIEQNLGEIYFKKIIIQKIEFKEEIKSAVSSCECLKVNIYKKEEPKAEPIYVVNMEFDPKDYEGPVSQDIMLLDKNDDLITLRIKAVVK